MFWITTRQYQHFINPEKKALFNINKNIAKNNIVK